METERLNELRPLIYQHMCLLTASGRTYISALKQAALVAVVAFDGDLLAEAIELAEKSLFDAVYEETIKE